MEDEIRNEENAMTTEETCTEKEASGGIGTGVAMLLGAALAVGVGAGGKKLYGWLKQRKEKKFSENLEKVEDVEVVDSSSEESK